MKKRGKSQQISLWTFAAFDSEHSTFFANTDTSCCCCPKFLPLHLFPGTGTVAEVIPALRGPVVSVPASAGSGCYLTVYRNEAAFAQCPSPPCTVPLLLPQSLLLWAWIKWEVKQWDRNHEKNQTNSDAEKCKTNKMKNAIESFNKLNQAKEEFVNLKTVLLILSKSERKEFRIKSVRKFT